MPENYHQELKRAAAVHLYFFIFIFLYFFLIPAAVAQRKQSFDEGWRFHRGAAINAEAVNYDDSRWRQVIVPHDFSMEPVAYVHDYREQTAEWKNWQVGPFSRLSPGDSDSGQTLSGSGWYRKTFRLPGTSVDEALRQQLFRLRFDGVYNQAEVWVNGVKAGMNVFGYMPFVVDLNPVLSSPENLNPQDPQLVTIAVHSISEGLNSRWYSGSGIYRHVWLEVTDKVHLDEWDTYVDASALEGKKARIRVSAKVFNEGTEPATGEVLVTIADAGENIVATATQPFSQNTVSAELTLKSPHLWSPDSPYRYTARISLRTTAGQHDALVIPFGVRSIAFSAERGFLLNGQPTKLRGGCVHHDNGLLGTAAVDRAEVRKAELLKAQGFNAVRTSHNLPSEAFLYACDSLGLLVIDECFDQWEEAKRRDDYSNYFSREKQVIRDGKPVGTGVTNFEYDAALMVRRDRNHPSVILWSIGNEVAQRSDVPRGKEIADAITRAIKHEDTTRPTLLAVCDYWDRQPQKMTWEKDSPRAFELVEVGGYNYQPHRYESDHAKFPQRIICGTESYPNAVAAIWNNVNRHDYVIGDFVWTAIDYIGEAGLSHALERSDRVRWIQLLAWPWFNAWCGDLDLTGTKKPQSYYRDVVWGLRPIAMAVRPSVTDGEYEDALGWCWTAEENHWNWHASACYDGPDACGYLPVDLRPEKYDNATLRTIVHDVNGHRSDSLRVNVYTREPRVRLSVNGRVLGEQDVNPETYTATFRVAYEPGELKAETVKGKRSEVTFRTSGAPTAIQFLPVQGGQLPQTSSSSAITSSSSASSSSVSVHDGFPVVTPPSPSPRSLSSTVISASHNDLAYIYLRIVDADGNLCPTAELPLDIKTSGAHHLAIAGTGHPYDLHSFRSLSPTTFRGQALLIIQPQEERGTVTITATSPKLPSPSTFNVVME